MFSVVNSAACFRCGAIDADSSGSLSRLARTPASANLTIATARHSPQSLILVHRQSRLRMPGGAVAVELGKLEQKAKSLTPFEKEVTDATRRRDANKKRERALALRQRVTPFDIDRILARGDCLSQHAKDIKLVRDPQLFLKWTPLYPHPLSTSYTLFDNEEELRRLAVLPPEARIFSAAAAGRAWCVEELFAQGCPIDSKHGSGITALHVAAMRNDVDTLRVLLNLKVDVNATNRSGATPLACAIGGRGGADGECANLLRESGGVLRLVEDAIVPGSILDVPLRRPRRVIDEKAESLGRMVFTGQF